MLSAERSLATVLHRKAFLQLESMPSQCLEWHHYVHGLFLTVLTSVTPQYRSEDVTKALPHAPLSMFHNRRCSTTQYLVERSVKVSSKPLRLHPPPTRLRGDRMLHASILMVVNSWKTHCRAGHWTRSAWMKPLVASH